MDRNTNIDGLRFIAAIGVISLHVGNYPELPGIASDIIRSSFRWCVPFFFMVTGYYLASPTSPFPERARLNMDRLSVPFMAFVISCLIFLPVFLAQANGSGVRLDLFVRGTYVHLWYLTALIIAYLAFFSLPLERFPKTTSIIAAGLTLAFVFVNYYFALHGRYYDLVMVVRELIGIPCILVGGLIRSQAPAFSTSARLFWAGLALLICEFAVIRFAGKSPGDLQFFLSTAPLTAGLLGVALQSRNALPAWLSRTGEHEGLGIYLYHPAFILLIASFLAGDPRTAPDGHPGLPMWIGSAVLTTAAMLILRRHAPTIRAALDGRLQK